MKSQGETQLWKLSKQMKNENIWKSGLVGIDEFLTQEFQNDAERTLPEVSIVGRVNPKVRASITIRSK
jgi:hypothetical protein